MYLHIRLIYSKLETWRKEEGWGASRGSKTGNLSGNVRQRKPVQEQRFLSFWKGDLGRCCVMEFRVHSGPWKCKDILELNPEHSWADHSVPVVLWGKF